MLSERPIENSLQLFAKVAVSASASENLSHGRQDRTITSSILLVVPDRSQQAATIGRWGMANWSTAFVAFLEKRGWLSVDVRTLGELKGPREISRYDLVILAWHGDGGPNEEQAEWFASSGRPTLIEGPVSPALVKQLGLDGSGDPIALPISPSINVVDGDLRRRLGWLCPQTLGTDPGQILLEDKKIALKEKDFDFIGARFKALKAARPSEAAAHMLISLLQGFRRRFKRQGLMFDDVGLDLAMAHGLQLVAAKLGSGRHADRARKFIVESTAVALQRFANAQLSDQERAELDPLRARLEGGSAAAATPAESLAQRNAERLSAEVKRNPNADLDELIPRVFPRINIARLLLVVGYIPDEKIRERVFLHLRDRFYSPQGGGFRTVVTLDGKFQLRDGLVTHPSVVQCLAMLSGPIEMPHFGDLSWPTFTKQQTEDWNRPPLLHRTLRGDGWDVLLAFTATDEPALLQRGMTVVSSFPWLAWVIHYYTIGPLPESYDMARTLGFSANEELLVLCIERLVRLAARPVPRLAPWPWGYDYVLSIRHDVDRIPEAPVFERLMDFHRSERLGVTWFWLPWRLDREKMRAQLDAGHEIALHSVRSLEKREECEAIAEESGAKVVGEAYHGSAADFLLGAPSAMESIRAGLSYSELAPNMKLFPYGAYPWLEADGSVTLRRGCIGISQSTGTDTEGKDVNPFDLGATVAFNLEWAGRGLAIVLVNHPDLNFERVRSVVSALPAKGRLDWQARQIADWWRRTHQVDQLTWRRDGDALIVTAKEAVADLSLILPGAEQAPQIDGEVLGADRIDRAHDGELRIRLSLAAGVPVRIQLPDSAAERGAPARRSAMAGGAA